MTKITVKKLTTSNTTPTLTGTVDFQRFSAPGKAKESIEVYVNYVPYRLFEGNLGLDETKTPNEWKLTFDSPLYPGTYDVEAIVYDIATNQILASDETFNELIITAPPTRTSAAQQQYDLRQRYQRLNLLMNSINLLFGGKSGLTPLPAVHPTMDDQSSTTLLASGNEERSEEPAVKSDDATRRTGVAVPPSKHAFRATDGSDDAEDTYDLTLGSGDQAQDLLGDVQKKQDEAQQLTTGAFTGNLPEGSVINFPG